MSSFINSVCARKSHTSLILSEYQHESKSAKESHKKKQIVLQREGGYYCTYIVDEKGQKILLNRVPIAQTEEKKNLGKAIGSNEIMACDYDVIKNARTAFECKQQIRTKIAHKENLQETMNILKEYVGIPNDSSKTFGY